MELNDLYQEIIIDHGTKPRNYEVMLQPSHSAEGLNPLCGDQITLFLQIQDNIIQKASFTGKGCAISTASASIMTEALVNKSITEALQIFKDFHALVTNEVSPTKTLGKLIALSGVKAFPARIKCATLAWHTLDAAIKNKQQISTE